MKEIIKKISNAYKQGGISYVINKILKALYNAPMNYIAKKFISKIDYYVYINSNEVLYQGGGSTIHKVKQDLWITALTKNYKSLHNEIRSSYNS